MNEPKKEHTVLPPLPEPDAAYEDLEGVDVPCYSVLAIERLHQQWQEALQVAVLAEREACAKLHADAVIGARVHVLCGGGPFDLTDSPKSFVSTCVRLLQEQGANHED